MSNTVTVHTKRYVMCPGCGAHEWAVEHLFDSRRAADGVTTAGPWTCDECDATWDMTVDIGDGTVSMERRPTFYTRDWNILSLKLGDGVVRMIVPGLRANESLTDMLDHKRYFFEEHTCPENYFRQTQEVTLARGGDSTMGEADPHGLCTFEASFTHPARPHHIHGSDESLVLVEAANVALRMRGVS